MIIGCNIWMICLELHWLYYDPSQILQLSEFVCTLHSSVWVFYNNFLLIKSLFLLMQNCKDTGFYLLFLQIWNILDLKSCFKVLPCSMSMLCLGKEQGVSPRIVFVCGCVYKVCVCAGLLLRRFGFSPCFPGLIPSQPTRVHTTRHL